SVEGIPLRTPDRPAAIPRRLEEFGDSLRGPGGTAGLDRAVIGLALELLDDGGGNYLGRRASEVHRPARPIAIESMAHMEVLLEVMPQREIDERPPVGGQLHSGGEAAL